jgi:hypothetical protein
MKATVRLERPEEVEATITLTMPMRDWKLLLKDIRKIGFGVSHPTHQFSDALAELVVQTEQTILAQPVIPPESQFSEAQQKALDEGRLPELEIVQVTTATPRRRPGTAGATS